MSKRLLNRFLSIGIMVFMTHFAEAQIKITGLLQDESQQPLIGANVLVKGTQNGTITDIDGRFSIDAQLNDVIQFSYVGFQSKEHIVTSAEDLVITIESGVLGVSEVVVVAYGTVKRSNFTGSANTISSEQLSNRSLGNVASALVGAAPGVQTNAVNGQPGSAPAIRVRGFGSVNASNAPLFVVDGVPFSGNVANINADDVESISILKDAASTALYGSRAANGVVMITTKKGKIGHNNVSLKLSRGVSSRALPEYERVDAFQYYPLMWEAYRNSLAFRASNPVAIATASETATKDIAGLLAYNPFNVAGNTVVGTDGKLNPAASLIYNPEDLDWQKFITRQGNRNDASVNISGGQGKMDYLISLGYLDEKSFLVRSDFKRYTGRVNINNQALPWFRTGLNLSGTFVKSNLASSTGGTALVNPFNFARNIGPIFPVYAYDPANPGQYLLNGLGEKQYDFGNLSALGLPNRPGGGYGGRHIVAETELNQEFFNRNAWGARTYGEISFLKDFKFTTNVTVDASNRTDYDYDNAIIGDGAPGGRSDKQYANVTSFTLNQLLNYSKAFGRHNFDFLFGHENFDYKDDNLRGFRAGQILEGNIELVNFTTTTTSRSEANKYKIESYFSRLMYDIDNKYFATLSYRTDGSSKFSKKNRWGDFYSASAAWRMDQESFIKNISWINALKLRTSYGVTGNDGVLDPDGLTLLYPSQPLYTIGFNNAAEPGIIQNSLGNEDLEWESNTTFDVALEFEVFKSRLGGTIEYFDRKSDNLLFQVPLPISAGITSQIKNVGSMFNRGVELNLFSDIIRTKNFNWNINFNVTALKNQITKLPQEEIISGTKKLSVGHSIYDYWLRDWYGVDPANGNGLYIANAFSASNTKVLANGDSVSSSQNNARFHYAGSAIPDFYGSVTNTFTYKGLSLSTLLTYQRGGLTYDATYATLMSSGNYGAALHKDLLRRWQTEGDITNIPRMDVSQTAVFGAQSDRWLTDASFINIRNVELAYTFSKKVVNKMKISGARVFLNAENLKMFSKRTGMNPEESFTGVTSNEFIPARIISGGVNINF
ncbi:MAG: SusC/RagA family TonB-linked outer membrane protein [Saprospiraceae bacterium]|nr:SusC/RagA family TonB-linked outer membrane protein [Saprospiraceae bacterium]